ncbi:MAG: hypothetical protein HC935_08880, partial [Pseudanabaena sp. SU_2_4]|nr:hypothetical protein [Pseudanabaena sp. SU_2_4]
MLENAGADKGVLLLPHKQEWFVEAVATLDDQPAHIASIPFFSSPEIPHSLINLVKRSRQPVVIDDAIPDGCVWIPAGYV